MDRAQEAMEKAMEADGRADEALDLARSNESELSDLKSRVDTLEAICGDKAPAPREGTLQSRVKRLEELNRSNPQALVRGALERDQKYAGQNTLEGDKALKSDE